MTTNRQHPHPAPRRETLAEKQESLLAFESEQQTARRHALSVAGFLLGGALIVGTVSMLTGCGDHSQVASKEQPAPMQQNAVASIEHPVVPAQSVVHRVPSGEVRNTPPDVVFAVSDTFVTAGQPIEITASGTEDVAEMALSDGRGDALPMVRDSTGNTWRVNYRVPIRPHGNRLGLSVTAKNETQQWRRVWLFLQINDGKQEAEQSTPEDTTTGQK